MTDLTVEGLMPLTTRQYDEAREKALERVAKRIGDKPTRKQFLRELAPLWTILDIIALVVFVPALLVSSVHIISHMGALANQSYEVAGLSQAGTIISRDAYVAIHQWFMIPLAEGSMILFMVMFGLYRHGWRHWVYLALAFVALLFVTVANWQSGIGALESILAPIFTIGIGLKLEHLIVQMLKRRSEVDTNYLQAVAIWEAATADATSHPDYLPVFRQEVWAALVKKNKEYADAPRGFKYGAVEREMARDRWAYEPAVAVEVYTPDVQQPVEEVKPKQGAVPFGEGGGLMLDDHVNMPLTLSANGHGTTEAN
ncbi:MAG: hypothetical protein LCI00_05425 [Chloroflexi bacterium]|nr:hypothetical protein [Chloroflexota bacterium]